MSVILSLMIYSLYLLPFVILYVIFGSVYYSVKARLVDKLVYTREFSVSDAFSGDELFIIETITNPTPFPLFFVDVESYIHSDLLLDGREKQDGMQMMISRFHLRGRSKTTRTHKVHCMARGYYAMTVATVLTKGLGVEKTKDFTFSSELYVYPEVTSSIPSGTAIGRIFGESMSLRQTVYDPFSVSGVRDYTFGDPVNSINFKATARSYSHGMRGIKVNNYDFCCDRAIMLCLDFSSAHELETLREYEWRMEKALSLCASVVAYGLKNGHKVGFTANCRTDDGANSVLFPVSGGEFRLCEIFRMMSKIRIAVGASFASVLEQQNKSYLSGAELYVLTASSDSAVADAVDKLKRSNSVCVVKI